MHRRPASSWLAGARPSQASRRRLGLLGRNWSGMWAIRVGASGMEWVPFIFVCFPLSELNKKSRQQNFNLSRLPRMPRTQRTRGLGVGLFFSVHQLRQCRRSRWFITWTACCSCRSPELNSSSRYEASASAERRCEFTNAPLTSKLAGAKSGDLIWNPCKPSSTGGFL